MFDRWGRDGLWWLTLLLILVASCVLELSLRAIKSAIWPTEVETFQTLEQDPAMLERFQESSAMWLQAHHENTKPGDVAVEQPIHREDNVKESSAEPRQMRTMEEGRSDDELEEEIVMVADGRFGFQRRS